MESRKIDHVEINNTTPTSDGSGCQIKQKCPTIEQVEITFDLTSPTAKPEFASPYSLNILKEILHKACIWKAKISSTKRTNYDQARIMYDNIKKNKMPAQRAQYGYRGSGAQALNVYEKNFSSPREEVIKKMKERLDELPPMPHVKGGEILNVIDIAPSSIPPGKHRALVKYGEEYKKNGYIKKFLHKWNSSDAAFHFEIDQREKKPILCGDIKSSESTIELPEPTFNSLLSSKG